ncbi:hypothetical protein Agub_g8128 [Astrephomene gubernaculifera]|uniref:Myb-like domain-containing protein n=1 Tax=Astrephomene gubernaculifera TaxID=47775 RepID=A0AAD3HMU1_9CHLO|nr:hypothetical protein Agub_g8128 [Astrephomene gubernaculifera]
MLAALVDSLTSAAAAGGGDVRERQTALLVEALKGIDVREEEAVRAREAAKRDAEAAAKAAAREEHRRKMAAMREWSEEELRLLDKACSKYPMGTPKRWEAVAGFVRTRTLEEVLLMVKDRQGASATRMKAQEDWKGAQKKPAEVRATADTRAQAFTDVEVKLAGDAAAKLLNPTQPAATSGATASAPNPPAPPAPAAAAAAAAAASPSGKKATAAAAPSSSSSSSAPAPAAAAAAPAAAAAAASSSASPATSSSSSAATPAAAAGAADGAGAGKAGGKKAASDVWTEVRGQRW